MKIFVELIVFANNFFVKNIAKPVGFLLSTSVSLPLIWRRQGGMLAPQFYLCKTD